MKSFAFGLFGLLLLAFTPPAMAASDEIVGTVLEVEGTATVTGANGAAQPVYVNSPIHPTDVIVTGPASRVYLQLIDNTEFTVGENGQMSIDEYDFDTKNKDNNHATYSVAKGAFLYVSGLVAKKENPDVTVNVPVGSIGIRGTKFWGGDLDGAYNVIVGEGEVELANAGGKVRLKKGQGTRVKGAGIAPEPAKTVPQDRIARAVATVALANPGVVGERMKSNAANNEQLRVIHRENVIQRRNLKEDVIKEEQLKEDAIQKEEDADAAARRKRLKEERERRFNASNEADAVQPVRDAGDAASNLVRGTGYKASETVRGTTRNVVEPVAETITETKTKVLNDTGETVSVTVEKTVETVEKPVEVVGGTVKEVVKETVEVTKEVVKGTGETVKGTTNVVKGTTNKLLNPLAK